MKVKYAIHLIEPNLEDVNGGIIFYEPEIQPFVFDTKEEALRKLDRCCATGENYVILEVYYD